MPALATILLWVGRTLLGQFLARALLGAGLGLVTYHYGVSPLFTYVRSMLSGTSAEVAGWIGFLNIDRAFTVLSSAYVIRMARSSIHLTKAATAS